MQRLDATTVPVPDLPVTILQFGGGNFLRAFADQMIQQANDSAVMHDGVALVYARPRQDPGAARLREQDGLYHVLLEGVRDGQPVREFTLVTAIRQIVAAHADFDRYRELCLSPELKVIVSNTTEAGIVMVAGDDLAAKPPASFPAKVTALLRDRFHRFEGAPSAGLHVVCCELIDDNATTLRRYVLQHAADNDLGEEFVNWVRSACHFHDTLVDRIVPGYPADEIEQLQQEIGYADACLVKGEYFGIWAIGGDPSLRDLLPLDRAGAPVLFLENIRPFRDKKVRILNGLHTALTAVSLQLGCESVREAIARPDVAAYVNGLLEAEILPSIDGDADELRAFAAGIVERFDNPYLHHRLDAISLNSLAKWQARNLPVVLDAWRQRRGARRSTFALAALLVLYSGHGRDLPGFPATDDEALLNLVRTRFDGQDLVSWVQRVVAGAGFLSTADPLARRLAGETAAQARAILAGGVEQALGDLLAADGNWARESAEPDPGRGEGRT